MLKKAEIKSIVVPFQLSLLKHSFNFPHLTFKGENRLTMQQVAVQTWKDGKVIREDFYHA